MPSTISSSFTPTAVSICSVSLLQPNSGYCIFDPCTTTARWKRRRYLTTMNSVRVVASSSPESAPKVLTFLGKGGSGKTTAAFFAAQHYAMDGRRTCLVLQSQDPTPDYLLNCKIGSTPTVCNGNLSVVRLESSKLLLQPLDWLKRADSRLKITQGILEGVVGEELGVLPAMDSILGAFGVAQKIGLLRTGSQSEDLGLFDIVIYDGMSTDETIRLLGSASKARLYLKYLRSLTEKTDIGRVIGPSIMSLVDEVLALSGSSSYTSGKTSAEIWNLLEKMLESWSSNISDPCRFGCILVMDPSNPCSVNAALRYWGCAIQAGASVSGALGIHFPHSQSGTEEEARSKFKPLQYAYLPQLAMEHPPNWSTIMASSSSYNAKAFFSSVMPLESSDTLFPVKFDAIKRSITLFMPGFDKSEIKLFQYRGGSELLVEAGDQRRVICLPPKLQGKVAGAKFVDRDLIITLR